MSAPSHFSEVVPGLWRSAQPVGADQWGYIAGLGIVRAVKLNTLAEGSDADALGVGIAVYQHPMPPVGAGSIFQQAAGVFEKPSKQTMDEVLRLMSLSGTLVHCTHGQDRTSLAVGAYRVKFCGWSKEQAWQEMIEHGFDPEFVGLDAFWLEDVTKDV